MYHQQSTAARLARPPHPAQPYLDEFIESFVDDVRERIHDPLTRRGLDSAIDQSLDALRVPDARLYGILTTVAMKRIKGGDTC
jgi:hypothetical protein